MNNIQVIDDGANLIGTSKDLKIYLARTIREQFDEIDVNYNFNSGNFEDALSNAKSIYEALYENDEFRTSAPDDYFKINYDNNFQELFVTKI